MARVRLLGPRDRILPTLRAVQDFGKLHLAESATRAGMETAHLDPAQTRRRGQLERILEDIDDALHQLGADDRLLTPTPATVSDFARWARLARRTRTEARALRDREAALEDEQALVRRYRDFLQAVLPAVRKVAGQTRLTSHAVVVPAAARGSLDARGTALRAV
jgi:hypothetical protein